MFDIEMTDNFCQDWFKKAPLVDLFNFCAEWEIEIYDLMTREDVIARIKETYDSYDKMKEELKNFLEDN